MLPSCVFASFNKNKGDCILKLCPITLSLVYIPNQRAEINE